MDYIKWKEECSVSNKMIDFQHKELFAMTNNFYNSIRKGANKQGMLKFINDLNNYVLFPDFDYAPPKKLFKLNYSNSW
jgi:hemerythrin